MPTTAATLTVPARFNGPPDSGNGGWVAGALASFVAGRADGAAVTVRLSAPPPLDVPLDVVPVDGGVRLQASGAVLATAVAADLRAAHPYDEPDPAVSFEDAVAAAAQYPGADEHPYPGCFVCGPDRADGLRLAPGRPPGGASGTVAAAWVPDASVDAGDGTASEAVVWSALDCPGGWTADIATRPMLLGTVTGTVLRRPAVGERCVVTGTLRGIDGRKTFTTTTLWSADGERLAATASVWIALA